MTRWLTALRHRWRALRHGTALDRDLDRELQAHLEDQVEYHVSRGVPMAEARRRARLDLGSLDGVTEACREARGVTLVHDLGRDLRYGWRALVRQPMLLAAAATSIALGVGVNLTVFSLASELLFTVPSASRAGELMHIRTGAGSHVPYDTWRAFDEAGALAGVAGYRLELSVNWRRGDETIPVVPMVVTHNFFDVVGLPVARGRGFGGDEARAERTPRLVVLTDGFWRRELGGRPDVLGQALTLNGDPYTVVGVLPSGSRSLAPLGIEPDVYLPLSRDLVPAIASPRASVLQLVGRRRPGDAMHQARAAFAAAAARVSEASGLEEVGLVTEFSEVGGLGQAGEFDVLVLFFGVLMVVGSLVLLIACANVAGLLLARNAARRREVAMRVALGASRGRLVRQFLTESLLLAALGTVAGLGLTALVGAGLSRWSPPFPVPVVLDTHLDGRLLLFALAMVAGATLVTGLMPALHATRPAMAAAARPSDAGGQGPGRFALRRLLVTGQVAVSALLLVVALVFVRNLLLTASMEPGFDVERTVVARVQFVEGGQGTPALPAAERLAEVARGLPGVASAAFTDSVPLTLYFGATVGTELRMGDNAEPRRADFARQVVGPGYFETMGIAVRGRAFTAGDRQGAPDVAMVNEAFAREYFEDANPIGQSITDPREDGQRRWQVIGVAADSKYRTLGEPITPALYLPVLQSRASERFTHLVVRASGDPAALAPALRRAILEAEGSVAVTAEPMRSALAFAFLPSRIGAWLLGSLGVLGTVLAMVGLYGVVSYSVGRRTTEIGVRLALGATRASVVRLAIGDAAVLVIAGLVAGLGLGLLATRPLAAFLVTGLSPSDPASFAGTALLLLAVSLAAAWAPVRRASAIAPMAALRHD